MSTREKIIKSHIKHDDYFATLTMVIDALVANEETTIKQATKNVKTLKQLKNDFAFLQKNFKLIKK